MINHLISIHSCIENNNAVIIENYSKFLQRKLTESMFIGDNKFFEGFEYDGFYIINKSNMCIHRNGLGWNDKTIEDLVRYKLVLTETAKKEIYG